MNKIEAFRITEEKHRSKALCAQLLAIWESAVRATHTFLSDEEIVQIKQYVPQALCGVPVLAVARDEDGTPLGFAGISGTRLEMLFVSDAHRGQGIGKKLLLHAMEHYGVCALTVNEQNPQARGFYEHMGFSVYKRTALDEQGGPYPLLYMKK